MPRYPEPRFSADESRSPAQPPNENGHAHPEGGTVGPALDSSLSEMVSAYEKCLIEDALRATRGNRAKAARLLRTTERILGYRIHQYDIDWKGFRP